MFTGGTEFLPSIDKGLIEATLNFGTAVTPEQAAERAAEAERMIRENVENIESISYQVGKLGTNDRRRHRRTAHSATGNAARIDGRAVESIRRALSAVECSEVGVSAIDGVVAVLTSGFRRCRFRSAANRRRRWPRLRRRSETRFRPNSLCRFRTI